MRWSTLPTILCLLLCVSSVSGQTAPELDYDAVAPLRLPPDLYLGEAAGVAVNSQGHIFVYSRTGSEATIIGPRAASLYEFEPDGTFVGRSAATSSRRRGRMPSAWIPTTTFGWWTTAPVWR